jgi:hypothetical protein
MIYWPALLRHDTQAATGVGELDFSAETAERGPTPNRSIIPKLHSSAKTLLLVLPAGSEIGEYEVEIRSGADIAKAVKILRGDAVSQVGGRTELRCDLGVPSLQAGSYVAAWRPRGNGLWHYETFIVS